MIFNFLRKYLQDDEFEKTKIELDETRQVLKEYKEFLTQSQNKNANDERQTVDLGFIALMWASTGFAIKIFIESAQAASKLKDQMDEPFVYIWISLALFSFYFISQTGINAIILTRKYIASKEDPIYRNYGWYITTGAILLVIATLALAFLR